MPKLALDFYEIQKRQRARSLFLFGVILLFHFTALGIVGLALLWSFGLFLAKEILQAPDFWTKFLAADLGLSVVLAGLHFMDARKNGARYILKRLEALAPDSGDRYHKQFVNTVDEIRIAAGLPRVNAYVLPSFAFNSMALIEEDGTPSVAVSEGLLAEGTRDEIQAVAAHELAHIARGDAFYMTIVCSFANLFEKLKEALEPEDDNIGQLQARHQGGGGFPPVLFYIAVSLSTLIMHLLSTLISRERELLADAAAVEFNRSPESLARAVYKAHIKNSFVGDFSLTYTPLFIVPPDSRDITESLSSRIFNSHPPLMKRIGILAEMAGKSTKQIVHDVRESETSREQARTILESVDESRTPQPRPESTSAPSPQPASPPTSSPPDAAPDDTKIWLLRLAPDKFDGPFTISELLCHPRFTLLRPLKNTQEGVEAKAREFPQVRIALKRLARKTPLEPSRQNLCPRCRIPLTETSYEGVSIKACKTCRGRLVAMAKTGKIIARREVAFSDELKSKARTFREKVLLNPLKKQKANASPAGKITCPDCGYRMVPRPYNYQYFIPVDKCLSCSKIWFDSDELEILQILIEDR